VAPPFHLAAPQPRLDQDGEFVQPHRHRTVEPQIVQKIQPAAFAFGTAQHDVVGPTDPGTGEFHDPPAHGALLVVEIGHGGGKRADWLLAGVFHAIAPS
jgi:hypothetical protein